MRQLTSLDAQFLALENSRQTGHVGGLAIVTLRPEVRWLGCAALPEACVAGTNPAAVAVLGD